MLSTSDVIMANMVQFLVQHPLQTAQDCILESLIDWATLMVDPTGTSVPAYRVRSAPGLRTFTASQKHQWNDYLCICRDRLLRLCHLSLERIHGPLLTVTRRVLESLTTMIIASSPTSFAFDHPLPPNRPDQEGMRAISHQFTRLLCQVKPIDAMEVVEAIIIAWLRLLPPAQVEELRATLAKRNLDPWPEATIRTFALERLVIDLQEHP